MVVCSVTQIYVINTLNEIPAYAFLVSWCIYQRRYPWRIIEHIYLRLWTFFAIHFPDSPIPSKVVISCMLGICVPMVSLLIRIVIVLFYWVSFCLLNRNISIFLRCSRNPDERRPLDWKIFSCATSFNLTLTWDVFLGIEDAFILVSNICYSVPM